jgi:hypothetical protein
MKKMMRESRKRGKKTCPKPLQRASGLSVKAYNAESDIGDKKERKCLNKSISVSIFINSQDEGLDG